MPRAALSQSEVDEFRDTLCAYATRLFAEQGYDGVTMRALATGLGCSPMTPYRYFENKAEIFRAVRAAGAARFANALENAVRGLTTHREKLSALTRAYVRFALAEPHAYRIMFELDQDQPPPEERDIDLRSWRVMHAAVEAAIEDGVLDGDPQVVAHLLWSGVHGLVALHLSGMLRLGRNLEELVAAFIERELGRLRTRPTSSIPVPTATSPSTTTTPLASTSPQSITPRSAPRATKRKTS
jgi:AcrR family transcriptional regulator